MVMATCRGLPSRGGPILAATRGRRGVPTTVTLRATALADLRDELEAERAEGVALAETALDASRFIEAYYHQPHVVMHHAHRIGYSARRYLRQRGAR
jgi:hypothetical protein